MTELMMMLLLFLMRLRRIMQCSCLKNNLPFSIWHLCINLANTSFPRKILSGNLMTPMRVNINYSKRSITFFTDFNFNCSAIIVNQIIIIKEVLPVLAPTFTVKMPELENSIDRVMCIWMWWPRPNYIGMND